MTVRRPKNENSKNKKIVSMRHCLLVFVAIGILLLLFSIWSNNILLLTDRNTLKSNDILSKPKVFNKNSFNETKKSKHLSILKNEIVKNNQVREQSIQQHEKSKQQFNQSQNHHQVVVNEYLNDKSARKEEGVLFVDYKLVYDHPYNVTFGPYTQCHVGTVYNKWGRKPIRRVPLAKEFETILKNYTTMLSTNRKILSLGDSVGIQFHQVLEEAVGASFQNRTIYRDAWPGHESISIVAPISGGGVVAAFRMTGWLLRSGEGKPPPNANGGGWSRQDVALLLNHSYNNQQDQVHSFDSMILRIPHGWMTLDEITNDRLLETLQLSNELFGVSTVIILTLPLNNNVKTMEELEQLTQVNTMIRQTVYTWKAGQYGIDALLVMEFDLFEHDLTVFNSKLMEYDLQAKNATLNRLGCAKFPPSIAMICTSIVEPGQCACPRNMISIDGLHWCMETIGGRVIGAISCLFQCATTAQTTTNDNGSNKRQEQAQELRTCEQQCNTKFMRLSM